MEGAGTEDSGCRGPRGMAQAGVVATAPRPSECPLWVCGRKGGQCAWKPPEKGTDRARAKEAGQGCSVYKGETGRQTGNQAARRTQALALEAGSRSEGLQSRPRLEGSWGSGGPCLLPLSCGSAESWSPSSASDHPPCSCFTCFLSSLLLSVLLRVVMTCLKGPCPSLAHVYLQWLVINSLISREVEYLSLPNFSSCPQL